MCHGSRLLQSVLKGGKLPVISIKEHKILGLYIYFPMIKLGSSHPIHILLSPGFIYNVI